MPLLRPLLAAALAGSTLAAQGPGALQTAMNAELARNLQELSLPGLANPFYLGYHLRDLELTTVRASLGSLVSSGTWRHRDHRVDLLVGDAFRNNAHFVGPQALMGCTSYLGQVPLEDDPAGIRAAFWLATDAQYKTAAETFERKLAALGQQQLAKAWEQVPDLDQAPVTSLMEAPRRIPVELAAWERTAREVSAVLLKHPGIHASEVTLHFLQGERYLSTSEKAQVAQPIALAACHVSLRTQAGDGLPLADSVVYYGRTPQDLPEPGRMAREVDAAASRLEAARTRPAFDETYDGPVLFEDQAVGELVAQRFFSPEAPALVALRKPVFADSQTEVQCAKMPESMEDKLGARILPKGFTLKATPQRAAFEGAPLLGASILDAQAVAPQEVTLVDNGLLKDLLRGRTPTPKGPVSNGHQRPLTDFTTLEDAPGPTVIELETAAPLPLEDLRRELLRLAREAGLKHAYVIRKLASPTADPPQDEETFLQALTLAAHGTGGFARPVWLFRVDVETGAEQAVRNAVLGDISLMALRHLAGASAQRLAHTTLVRPLSVSPLRSYPTLGRYGWAPHGVAASFLVPRGLLFEELNLRRQPFATAPRPPVAPSPLAMVKAGPKGEVPGRARRESAP